MNNTLLKGLAILEELARSERPLGITELALRLGIIKSNVHRLLQGLIELDYVRRDDGGNYRSSIRLWQLGSSVLANFDLRQVAEPFMYQLLDQTRETVHLSIMDGDDVVYVSKLDSPEPVRAYSSIGGRAPAYCVATGKALLAYGTPDKLADISRRLEAHSPNTIIDGEAFLREMKRVRTLGYSTNRGEWRESVNGVAAPIFDNHQRAIAAIGLSGPATRLKPASFKSVAALVVAAAHEVTSRLADGKGSANPMARILGGMRQFTAASRSD